MRIGVNALYLIPGGVGGTEIYLRSLLAALASIDRVNDYFIFTNRETGRDLVPPQSNFHHLPQNVRATNRPARILWEQTALSVAGWRLRLHVLFNPGFTAPVLCACPQVTVFHDLQHKRHPEHFRWFDLPFWRVLLWLAAHRSRLLIAVSDATRNDLLHYYSLARDKIRVVPHGVEPAFFLLGVREREDQAPFVLTVSTLHPHKNLDGLLRAFAQFTRVHPEYRLVIAGLRGFQTEQLEALHDSLDLRDTVTFTGWIPRDRLIGELFANARAFVYPSTFEGFGMPVLEAMAAGIPTACSNIEPLAGIAGAGAITFDPADPKAICAALLRLVEDEPLRVRLSQAGRERARAFTWEAAAHSTLAALTEALP
ncbi:MAG: glycosyl transferase, group 1 [Bryobacterales bacterium]|nr:glycosyl transferase, group 1 [Bryobacterales bacterium]